MKKRIYLLIICYVALCLSASTVSADMFDFDISRIDMTFDGTRLNAWLNKPYGYVTLNRLEGPIETVVLKYAGGSATLGDFSLWMDLENITSNSASATGEFTLTDIDGDTITGDFVGDWGFIDDHTRFSGEMSDVQWASDDGFFNGDDGSDDAAVPLDLVTLPPWNGTIIDLTIKYPTSWVFSCGAWPGEKMGTIDANVIPTPAAFLLGILGLGAAGWKLRKFV